MVETITRTQNVSTACKLCTCVISFDEMQHKIYTAIIFGCDVNTFTSI